MMNVVSGSKNSEEAGGHCGSPPLSVIAQSWSPAQGSPYPHHFCRLRLCSQPLLFFTHQILHFQHPGSLQVLYSNLEM